MSRQTADWIDTGATVRLTPNPKADCSHTDHIHEVTPSAQGCEECLKTGDRWVHLRICMECGQVGCCDSSPGKHATAHYHATGHPVMRSIEPGETCPGTLALRPRSTAAAARRSSMRPLVQEPRKT